MNYNEKETMIFSYRGYDGVLKISNIERDGITLGEVAEVFTDFLVDCGYDYVTGVSIGTGRNVSHAYDKGDF